MQKGILALTRRIKENSAYSQPMNGYMRQDWDKNIQKWDIEKLVLEAFSYELSDNSVTVVVKGICKQAGVSAKQLTPELVQISLAEVDIAGNKNIKVKEVTTEMLLEYGLEEEILARGGRKIEG